MTIKTVIANCVLSVTTATVIVPAKFNYPQKDITTMPDRVYCYEDFNDCPNEGWITGNEYLVTCKFCLERLLDVDKTEDLKDKIKRFENCLIRVKLLATDNPDWDTLRLSMSLILDDVTHTLDNS